MASPKQYAAAGKPAFGWARRWCVALLSAKSTTPRKPVRYATRLSTQVTMRRAFGRSWSGAAQTLRPPPPDQLIEESDHKIMSNVAGLRETSTPLRKFLPHSSVFRSHHAQLVLQWPDTGRTGEFVENRRSCSTCRPAALTVSDHRRTVHPHPGDICRGPATVGPGEPSSVPVLNAVGAPTRFERR